MPTYELRCLMILRKLMEGNTDYVCFIFIQGENADTRREMFNDTRKVNLLCCFLKCREIENK